MVEQRKSGSNAQCRARNVFHSEKEESVVKNEKSQYQVAQPPEPIGVIRLGKKNKEETQIGTREIS